VDLKQSHLATEALAGPFDEILWVASDTSFHPDAVERLRAHRLPLVGGLSVEPVEGKFACAFLDAVPDQQRASVAIASLATRIDTSANVPVGGIEGEALRPLDVSPLPGSRSRLLFGEDQIEAHLDAVESEQQPDGGWMFDWRAWSPAQTTDWRGSVTLRALLWLRDNGRL